MLFTEFARFLHMYVKSKRYLEAGYTMDAYNCVLMALYHWARIEVGEAGCFPNPAVWEQVKSLNTPVHKLYEELTVSKETLDQRVELILLACEFALMSKMSDCCRLLLEILGSRKESWSIKNCYSIQVSASLVLNCLLCCASWYPVHRLEKLLYGLMMLPENGQSVIHYKYKMITARMLLS